MYPSIEVMANLGEQPIFANKDYRFMKHCLITDVDNGKLIFNGLTRTLIFLDNSEISEIGNINKYTYLYKYYFLVPEDFDEFTLIDIIRKNLQIPLDDLYLDHPQSFTILTTTKCNARCFYCYELNSKHKHHMTEETAEKVGNYIVNVADRNKQINLHWFGGEPLFNNKVIDIITNKLKENGQGFTTTFTTNGYLFDKNLILKAKSLWNTVDVQITIDGTESVYNKVKNYIHTNIISPYKKVLNNIAILLNNGINVTIRLNLDFHNADNLKQLIEELHKRFGNHPNLRIYAWPVFEDETNIKTKEEHAEIFKKLAELESVMNNYNYFCGIYPSQRLVYNQCMADSGDSVVISTDGDLGTCEHFIDDHFWSHVDNPSKKDFNMLKIWREYETPINLCADCPIYPSCIRPTHCVEMSKCDKYYKEWRIRRHIKGLLKAYSDYRTNNNTRMPIRLAENVM